MKIYKKILFIVIGILFSAACSSLPGSEGKSGDKSGDKSRVVFYPGRTAMDKGLTKEIVKRFGEPDRLKEEREEDYYNPQFENIRYTYIYENMELMVFEQTNFGQQILTLVILKGEGLEMENGLRVGLSREEVYPLIPHYSELEDEETIMYRSETADNNWVMEFWLTIENDFVVEVNIGILAL